MRVLIAGAHGQIARLLIPQLRADGHTVCGLIRNPDHAAELEELGAEPVVCDLEQATVAQIAEVLPGSGAALFAAGAGGGSSAARKLTMDRDGAVKLLAASSAADVRRFLIISSVGAEQPPAGEDTFSVYLRAKADADAAVSRSDRAWTIVRPGRLTDAPASGRARIDADPFRGEVARADVATVLARLLEDARSYRRVLYVNGGEEPIAAALDAALVQSSGNEPALGG
jgi:nucleoside-diphosphate-sugar epimerase